TVASRADEAYTWVHGACGCSRSRAAAHELGRRLCTGFFGGGLPDCSVFFSSWMASLRAYRSGCLRGSLALDSSVHVECDPHEFLLDVSEQSCRAASIALLAASAGFTGGALVRIPPAPSGSHAAIRPALD